MKKFISAVALIGVFAFSGATHAFAQSASSTPSHRHAVLAGWSDSISNRGAWILENTAPHYGVISYVVENPKTQEEIRVKQTWSQAILAFLAR